MKYIAGNWKTGISTRADARALAQSIREKSQGSPHKIFIAPSYPFLHEVGEILKGSKIILGAQDVGSSAELSRTGDVSVAMLKDCGVQSIIIGHSERRLYHHETSLILKEKMELSFKNGMEVIYCIGESAQDRKINQWKDFLSQQIEILEGFKEYSAQLVIAYEPIWAIGAAKSAELNQIKEVHAFIYAQLIQMWGEKAKETCIQYGGSVNALNAKQILNIPHVGGVLVGRASLDSSSFFSIMDYL